MSVIGSVFLNLISLNACMLSWGKLGGGSGLNKGIVAAEKWWLLLSILILLMSFHIRDVAELEEVSFCKPDKILPHSVLLACKQVQLIECILPSLRSS